MEIQEKLYATTQHIQRLAMEERRKMGNMQRAELTGQEVETMPDETRMYRAVGKAYFFSPKSEVLDNILTMVTESDHEIKALRAQRSQVEEKARATQEEFNELVRSSPLTRRNAQAA